MKCYFQEKSIKKIYSKQRNLKILKKIAVRADYLYKKAIRKNII